MSDRGKGRGGRYTKLFIILGSFVCASPFIGILIDVFILFPPSSDAHGHGMLVFTILMPLFALFITVVTTIVCVVANMSTRASAKSTSGRTSGSTYYEYQKYEYVKILQRYDGAQSPAMILHEVDTNAGRCSVRCIYIYQNGYVENFVNNGVYVPVPTVESVYASGAAHGQSAQIITGGEFESIWNIGHYAKA